MSRSLIKAAVLALPAFLFAQNSDAAIIYGLTENNNVFRFDSSAPETIETGVFVQGLGGAELLNIDFRPATGQLYALTTDNRILTLNPDTGAVTSSQTLSTPLNGTTFGFDFSPADVIRVVSDTGQNLRINPGSGAVTVDPSIETGSNLVGAAYNNILGGTTTLYTIDSLADTLNIQDPPNSGNQTLVGNLIADGDIHIDITNRVGFDIGPDNQAFAAFNEIGFSLSDLYTVNLNTGAIEFVGQIGGGMFVRDIAVVVPEPATFGLLAAGALLAARRRRAR